MKKEATKMGMNRTGIAAAPRMGPQAVEGSHAAIPDALAAGDGAAITEERAHYIHDSEPVGTVPPPATLKGAAKTAVAALTGAKATVFIDKLGERLAFERTGTRLYEAFIAKVWAQAEPDPSGPTVAELEAIRMEEFKHFELLRQCLLDLGADPTVQTPSADVAGVTSTGVLQVLTDPRTTIPQCLEAVLTAELVDNASWEMLLGLARGLGHESMAKRFQEARTVEDRHLRDVLGWLTTLTMVEAGAAASP